MLVHWIWLAHRPGVPDWMKAELMRHFSDPEDVYFAEKGAFSHIEGMTRDMVKALQDRDLKPCEKILADAMTAKLHILTYRDAGYPTRLKHISDPPLVLYYKGTLPDFDAQPVIGLVGTRKASAYGLTAAKKLGGEIARCGGLIVSGIASGIDAMAMGSALSAGGTVVGILGTGADMVYPAQNRGLFRDTEAFGCLISEFPPGTPPYKWNFPRRNRIISGMSCGVLVVEAPEISGSLITARHALEQGRDVFVVPGNVDQPGFVGSNQLLKEGAILASCGWDVMCEYEAQFPGKVCKDTRPSRQRAYPDEVARAGETDEKPRKVAQKPTVPQAKPTKKEKSNKKVVDNGGGPTYSDVNKDLSKLSPLERSIVEALSGGEQLVDAVIAKVDQPSGKVSAALTMLAIRGYVKKLPGNRVCLK